MSCRDGGVQAGLGEDSQIRRVMLGLYRHGEPRFRKVMLPPLYSVHANGEKLETDRRRAQSMSKTLCPVCLTERNGSGHSKKLKAVGKDWK